MNWKNLLLFRPVCVLFLIGSSSGCFAQLDSTFVSVILNEDAFNGTDSVTVVLTFDDISDVGHLSIVAYDAQSGIVINAISRSRAELDAEGYLLPGSVTYPLFVALNEHTYRIAITPKNQAGAHTEPASFTLVN